jgi:peptidoglycan hydrolase CwlO-like protein
MKCFLLLILAAAQVSNAARVETTPMARVVGLITQLKAKIESDGAAEQKSYDKYACWCEETLGRKASDIATAKETVDKLLAEIKKLKAEIASHGAEITQLKKDIAANLESQKEATEVRDKAYEEFNDGKNENEQCTGALEAAIKVLTGAGENRQAMMFQEAQLLSVVSGVRSVLKTEKVKTMADKDLEVIKRFVDHPETFVAQKATGFMQNNPFGDYAPQSTQIQGILKGMYDAFTMDIEKDNAEESDAQKSYEELMATKRSEQATLEATLETQEGEHATKTKALADSESLLDDTKKQLKEDEAFFEATKAECQVKAAEWSERSRLRTEELMGMGKAIEIMSGPEAQAIFTNATTTFVQLSKSVEAENAAMAMRNKVFNKLRILAGKSHNLNIGKLASTVKTGGHFDKVITSIDSMIAVLRQEEADDIAHKDRCERAENKNANDLADAEHEMKKSGDALERMGDKKGELEASILQLEKDIANTKDDMRELLEMRNEASKEFKQAMLDDTLAIGLLEKAIEALSAFYKRNKISMDGFLQKDDPEYTVDKDKAPTLSYEGTRTDGGVSGGAAYGGRKGETGGIVAIITMLKEDLEKEVNQGKLDNEEAEKQYEEQRGSLKKSLDTQEETKITTEQELATLEGKMRDIQEYSEQKSADMVAEKSMANTLVSDCDWVKTHFDSRREKRKTEMDGLEEAKNFLAGGFEMTV